MSGNTAEELSRIYGLRFEKNLNYRRKVWSVLVRDLFQRFIGPTDDVLDLGCGYGEFINQVQCGKRYAMDLNPDASRFLDSGVVFLEQDCSVRWTVEADQLDVVFTSNFFEHLPSKAALKSTLDQAFRCLKPGGKLIALGPNVKLLAGEYWDFWDHHLALSEVSLTEGMENAGFEIVECHRRFLPYTMVAKKQHSPRMISLYLKLPIFWRVFGKQFLLICRKPPRRGV